MSKHKKCDRCGTILSSKAMDYMCVGDWAINLCSECNDKVRIWYESKHGMDDTWTDIRLEALLIEALHGIVTGNLKED